MRDITLRLLVFWSICTPPACAPSVPSLGGLPTTEGGPDAALDRAPIEAAAPTARPDAGALQSRPEAGRDAAGETGRDAPGDPPREAAREAGSDASGDRAASETANEAAREPARDPTDAAPPDALTARAPRPGELVIDELLVDPDGNDLGHEWLELANATDETLDLSALHVSDGTTEVAVDAGVIEGRGFVVLGQSADRAHNGDAPVGSAYGTKLALNNGADRITICQGPCADGVTLAAFAWTEAFGAAYAGHAVVVAPGTGAPCPAAEPYGAAGNFGTPGRANPPCPAPAAAPDGGP